MGRHVLVFSLLAACSTVPSEGGDTDIGTETGTDGSTSTASTSAATATTGAVTTNASDSASATSTGSTTTTTTTSATGGSTSAGSTTGPVVECPEAAFAPGEHTRMLMHDGIERTYHFYIPQAHDGTSPWPLVMNFHPWVQNAEYQADASKMREKAEAEGFLVVHAQGISNSWNGGPECCNPAASDNVDDVGFVRAMVDEIETFACLDRKRVYSTGYSNGGFLSYRLACEAADLVTAIAPVVARMGLPDEECNPSRPVPVLAINGTNDNLVPYAQTVQSVELWAGLNNCVDEPAVSFENGAAQCLTQSDCDGGVEVTHCSISGAGHCWFGQQTCFTGPNSTDILATDAVWDFLKQWSM